MDLCEDVNMIHFNFYVLKGANGRNVHGSE